MTSRRAKPSKVEKPKSMKQKLSYSRKYIVASFIFVGIIGIILGIVCLKRQARQSVSTEIRSQASIHSSETSDGTLADFLVRSGRELDKKIFKLHPSNKKYDLSKYCKGVVAVSINAFLSASIQFCHKEGRQGQVEIISVGSGSGAIENEIITAYRAVFKNNIKITLVDIDPAFKADYRTVEELINKRPEIIGNCVLIIIWPEPEQDSDDNYDVDAIRYLRPMAVLVVYETMGSSGSIDFVEFLRNDSFKLSPEEYGFGNLGTEIHRGREYPELRLHYLIEELALQKVTVPSWGTRVYRMVIIRKKERTCPAVSKDEADEVVRNVDILMETNENFKNFFSYVTNSEFHWHELPDKFRSELSYAIKKAIGKNQSNALSRLAEYKNNMGLSALLMETFITVAVEFCRTEKQKKLIFLGTFGNILVPEIIAAYRNRYGSDIKITLIERSDQRIKNHSVERLESVEELVRRNAEIVRQSSLLIFWPPSPSSRSSSREDDRIDMNAIRILQPHAILTVYEVNGMSGSDHFLVFMRNESFKLPFPEYGLINTVNEDILSSVNRDDLKLADEYLIEEKVLKKVFLSRISGTLLLRMVVLKKKERGWQ